MRARLLSTLVLVPAVVALVLFAPTHGALVVVALPLLWAAAEWARLSGAPAAGRAAAVGLLAFSLAVQFVFLGSRLGGLAAGALGLVVTLLLVALTLLSERPVPRALLYLLGLLDLASLWGLVRALLARGASGREALLAFLVLVWVADSAAYLVGRRWGRRPLAPRVSPGKTREGAVAGLLGTLLAAGLLDRLGSLDRLSLSAALATGLAVWAFALLGDLAESRLKRLRGIKDSGRVIPGHGGLLDRIDGLLAAAPVFYCFWCLRGLG